MEDVEQTKYNHMRTYFFLKYPFIQPTSLNNISQVIMRPTKRSRSVSQHKRSSSTKRNSAKYSLHTLESSPTQRNDRLLPDDTSEQSSISSFVMPTVPPLRVQSNHTKTLPSSSPSSSSFIVRSGYSSPHPVRLHHKVYHALDLYDTNHYVLDSRYLYTPSATVLPPKQYQYLYRLSYLSLLSGSYALYQGHYDLALVPFGVFLTSINYWRHPTKSWRRSIDITYVTCCLLYQTYRSFGASNQFWYLIILICGMACFPFGEYYRTRNPTKSALWHGGVHLLGNVSNCVLYAGVVSPFVFKVNDP